MAYNEGTECCGLDNILCGDNSTEKEIKKAILEGYDVRDRSYFGVYTITTPEEKILERKLKNIGYKNTFSFYNSKRSRRLKMWTLELNKKIIKQFKEDVK